MLQKKTLFICAGCILALGLCILLGILCTPNQRPLKAPLAVYEQIANPEQSATDHAYTITVQTVIQVNGLEFKETSSSTILRRYQDGQPVFCASNQTVTMGTFQYTNNQWLENGTLYMDLNGCRFNSDFDAQDPFPPLILLSGDIYAKIDGMDWGDKITLNFQGANAPEVWALPKGAVFHSSSGSLTASKNKTLLQSNYSITYTHGNRKITQSYVATPLSPEAIDFQAPDKTSFTKISVVEAPLLLEKMSGYLLNAAQVQSNYDEYIYCQTFGDQRNREMLLTMNKSDPFSASLTTAATLVNSGRDEDVSSVRQEEVFKDGVYSRSSNAEPTVPDRSITQDQFQTHCQDILVGTILLPQFIQDVTVQEDESTITLSITPTEELAGLLCEEAGQNLYQDPTVLNSTASSSATELLSAYLIIDKSTGLPIASGIHYKGIYTITELPYRLEYTTDQTYRFDSTK